MSRSVQTLWANFHTVVLHLIQKAFESSVADMPMDRPSWLEWTVSHLALSTAYFAAVPAASFSASARVGLDLYLSAY